jgi:hypothetical protein
MEKNIHNLADLNKDLCIAISRYDVAQIQSLLNEGADVNGANNDPLYTLSNDNDISNLVEYGKCVDLLIENGLTIDPNQDSIARASSNGNTLLIDKLFEAKLVDYLKTDSPIVEASRNNDVQMLKVFEKHNQLTNTTFVNNAFCSANEESHIQTLNFLVDKIDRETLKHEALERAAYFNETKGSEHLIKNHGFQINSHNNSFVMTSILFTDISFVKNIILNSENPYNLITDENIINSIIKRDPVLMETIQLSMENLNKETFNKTNEKLVTQELSKSNTNTL